MMEWKPRWSFWRWLCAEGQDAQEADFLRLYSPVADWHQRRCALRLCRKMRAEHEAPTS